MQIKFIILTICASLAATGFAAPPPSVSKPADASKDAIGSNSLGNLSGTLGGGTGRLSGLLDGLLGGLLGGGKKSKGRKQPSKPQ
ncbi:hypothetical protein BCV72DRAFT_228718 [Rhizopus microsporus var. microsporus]|uniref:Uncharacterized protein n=1 Tax=Rhizopus microsporus var. microsporus TaxID=86635 RepID=A0A1X0R2A8_RHIZD|nr:hypothetical protein BCV72DRAFT_228718 [Rhizopus microsporus var. microsporus]